MSLSLKARCSASAPQCPLMERDDVLTLWGPDLTRSTSKPQNTPNTPSTTTATACPPQPRCLLRVDAGVPTVCVGLKVVLVALATSVPELGAGVGLWVVVPPHQVLPARPRVQGLVAAGIWSGDRRGRGGRLCETWSGSGAAIGIRNVSGGILKK